MENYNTEQLIAEIEHFSGKFHELKAEVSKKVYGNEAIIILSIIALISKGHILLEGVPGLAKTTLIQTISDAIGLNFHRIQFTPDLLPSDIIGTLIYNSKTQEFETQKGPIFSNFVLADEINRSPAKVQSALLEAMQEKQVTIGSETFKLELPFLVFATQNPIEQEGAYQLPEAQIDRFMFKLFVNYPAFEDERKILEHSLEEIKINKVCSKEDILKAQQLISKIYVDPSINQYILELVFATRTPEKYGLQELSELIQYGASPRATLAISHAARALAFFNSRNFVIPDDIKFVAPSVLNHRILLNYAAESESISSFDIIKKIFDKIKTP